MTKTENLTESQTMYIAARENADYFVLSNERDSLARVITRACILGEADFPLTKALMWQFSVVEGFMDALR